MILLNMSTGELHWHRTTTGELINSNEVHVWRVSLDVTTVEFESLVGFLSVDELARAGRFHFERDQRRFIVARGILRKILGNYLGENPVDIRFEYTSYGKPALAPGAGSNNFCFNLSHSDTCALYAITHGKKIGIDIERIRDDVAHGQIAQKFFSQGEIRLLEKTNKNKQSELFFKYWTRKEAILKARGEGISFSMERCDVSSISGNVLSPISLQENNNESANLYVQDLFPGNNYVAAIAVEGCDCNLSCWEYAV
jgi:4'-phosphopantetheinyl transferase